MNVTTGTLRRLYRRLKKPGHPFESMFRPTGSFKRWVKLNCRSLLKYYEKSPAFSLKAGRLLGI